MHKFRMCHPVEIPRYARKDVYIIETAVAQTSSLVDFLIVSK